jgi:hypothetical protein
MVDRKMMNIAHVRTTTDMLLVRIFKGIIKQQWTEGDLQGILILFYTSSNGINITHQ